MKFPISNLPPSVKPLCGWSAPVPGRSRASQAPGADFSNGLVRFTSLRPGRARSAGFTMIEIAICLAIIGFALVAIIGVLPLGMNTQRDNREETIINQDATVWLEAIRNGSHGADDLTNYIYAITNYVTFYDDQGKVIPPAPHVAGYTYLASSYDGTPNTQYLTNAMRIVGILSTPEYTDGFGGPPMSDIFKQSFASNHVVAYVRSISGLAAEKPPQPSDSLLFQDTLTYRLFCVNAPMPVNTNDFTFFAQKLAANQRELRLTFLWPQYPNGKLGPWRQTFRTTIAGQLTPTNYYDSGEWLYFYQSQSFTNAP
jgi:prepilin-type N-terminal cleavage/methylation domain-containing protein